MVETGESEAERILAFKQTLNDLVCNSKPHIIMLTELAASEARSDSAAAGVARVIEDRLREVRSMKFQRKSGEKPIRPEEIEITLLYLIDSIVKNSKDPKQAYLRLFTQNIVSNFCEFFRRSDDRMRERLYKLRSTWTGIFPNDKLAALDERIKKLDPAWPSKAVALSALTSAPPINHGSAGGQTNATPPPKSQVHLNRKFIDAQSVNRPDAAAARLRQETLKKIEEQKAKKELEEKTRLEMENRQLQLKLRAVTMQQQQQQLVNAVTEIQQQQQQQPNQAVSSAGGRKRKAHQPKQGNANNKRQPGRGRNTAQQTGANAIPLGNGNVAVSNMSVSSADVVMRSPPQLVGPAAPLYSRRPVASVQPMEQPFMNGIQYDDHFNNNIAFQRPPLQLQSMYQPESGPDYGMYGSGSQMHPVMDPIRHLPPQAFTHHSGPMGLPSHHMPMTSLSTSSVTSGPTSVSAFLSNLSSSTQSGILPVPSAPVPVSEQSNPLQSVLDLLGVPSGTINNQRQSDTVNQQHLLVQSAITSSPLVPNPYNNSNHSSSTRSPPSQSQQQQKSNLLMQQEKPLDWTSESLKTPRPSLVALLYDGRQCTNCPQRFHQMEEMYNKHLDWHYRQNKKKRTKSGKSAGQSRPWYYRLEQWLLFREINDDGEDLEPFEKEKKDEEEDGEEKIVRAKADSSKNVCKVCHEKFESVFRDEDEDWFLINAVEHESDVYHPACLSDCLNNGNASLMESSIGSLTIDFTAQDQQPEEDEAEAEVEPEPTLEAEPETKEADNEVEEMTVEPIKRVNSFEDREVLDYEAEDEEATHKYPEEEETEPMTEESDKQSPEEDEGKKEQTVETDPSDSGVETDKTSDESKETEKEPISRINRDRGNVKFSGREESAACLIM